MHAYFKTNYPHKSVGRSPAGVILATSDLSYANACSSSLSQFREKVRKSPQNMR